MAADQDKINELLQRLNLLMEKQDEFSKEIAELQNSIDLLRYDEEPLETSEPSAGTEQESADQAPSAEETASPENEQYSKKEQGFAEEKSYLIQDQSIEEEPVKKKVKNDLEKFIGENLINKIGIAITVIGVAIGGKYAIDNQLISPLSRIILGYLFGLGMLGVAIKLKKNFEHFSAVLLSGSMAINYFITFFAYDLYELIPQIIAFGLMVIFTLFTVLSALRYNMQLIAHIGLIGAYAVPFLLSDGSGRAAVLFSYVSVINAGILIIAIRRFWRPLFYAAFILSWTIYLFWFGNAFSLEEHFGLALIFLSVFFITFYITFIAYRLRKGEKFEVEDIIILLINSFIYYGMGYYILSIHEIGKELLGLFTLVNALVHFTVGYLFFRKKAADENVFYLVIGLVMLFITITIPIQLDGNWVTLFWAGEALILYGIGLRKEIRFYESLAIPLMILAFFSQMGDWEAMQRSLSAEDWRRPIFNLGFLASILFIAAFAFMNHLKQKHLSEISLTDMSLIRKISHYTLPIILLFGIYYTFRMEIEAYWQQHYLSSQISVNHSEYDYVSQEYNSDLLNFKSIWVLNYSLLFLSVLSFLNIKRIRSVELTKVNLIINGLVLFTFLTIGLYALSELRESYLNQHLSEYYKRTSFNVIIRYLSLPFLALLIFASHRYLRSGILKKSYSRVFDLLLHISILWVLSSELINIMDLMQSSESYKLGLSILWGVYCLSLIILGIWRSKKHLRIGAIAFFGITLLKLFFYDIAHLDTISKTIVLVSLGILLLVISFLYNKFKNLIADENN